MTSRKKVFDGRITIIFGIAVILLALWTLSNGIWQGSLFDGDGTWLIALNNQPVWNPPVRPAYADFRKVFDDLPTNQPDGWTIGIDLKWDVMLIEFLLSLLGVSLPFAVLSLINASGRQSLGIYLIRSLAVSLSGAAAACFVAWLVVGGWGPPSPLFFGFLGVVAGILIGVINWSRRKEKR